MYLKSDYYFIDMLEECSARIKEAEAGFNAHNYLSRYITAVNDAPKELRFSKQIDIFRFDPDYDYTINTAIKNNIR